MNSTTLKIYYDLIDTGSVDFRETVEPIDFQHQDHSWKCFGGPINLHFRANESETIIVAASSLPYGQGLNGDILCEIAVVNFKLMKAVRWFNPRFKESFLRECHEKGIDPSVAVGGLKYQHYDDISQFLIVAKDLKSENKIIFGGI